MRAWILLALAAALSGCATHRAHVAQGPDPLHDWASVLAIPFETSVAATVESSGVRYGYTNGVTDTTLTIRTDTGPRTIDRARIVRVEVRERTRTRWGWLDKPLAVGVVGGLVGTLVGAAMKNAKAAGISLGVFAASTIGGFFHLLSHLDDSGYGWRVVYVRP